MLTLKKFDLKDYVWSQDTEVQPIIYRNTLLGTMYPLLDIAIGDASGFMEGEEPDIDSAITAFDRGFEGYQIVGASGSRKKGYAFFVRGDNTDCFSRFFGSPSNCINYGSNLVTNCSNVFELKVTILVVPDGEYGTGDCHGKCSKDFAFGVVGQLQRPFQFRAAVKASEVKLEKLDEPCFKDPSLCTENTDEEGSSNFLSPDSLHSWVAKGTIAFSFDTGGYDLVLPESCFKGNKVKPGVYNPKTLYFGVVHQAEVRHVKMSYSVTQYLPWSAVEADILPGTIAQAHKLVRLESNTRELASFLYADKALDCEEECDEEDTRYISPVAQIVEADVHGQLIEHPWVVRHVREMLRKRWLRLATAGAVQFQSCMTMPDDSLGDRIVCIPHLPEGEVIVFPYPCRWKWDLQVWQNVHSDKWRGYEGIIAGSHSTMLTLGRDFDGDFVQFLPANLLPNVAAAVKEFGGAPELTKPAKRKNDGTLGEIAVRSMDNCVGLITWLIAAAWANGSHKLIPRLAQELQIEVDSLKNVQRADRRWLDDVSSSMYGKIPLWLSSYKDEPVFMAYAIPCNGDDTISRLATQVSIIWKQFVPKERSLIEFRDLFPACFPDSWRIKASNRRDEYQRKIKAAVKGGVSIASVIEELRELGSSVPEQHKFTAASAFWHVAHVQKSGTASFVFHAFLDQICEQLKDVHFSKLQIVGSRYGDYPEHTWNGEKQVITILNSHDPKFQGRLEAWIDYSKLGLLAADSAKYPAGTELYCSLTTVKGTVVAQVRDV